MSVVKEEVVVNGTDATKAMVTSVNRGLNSISSAAKGLASHMGLMSAVSVAGLAHIAISTAEAGEKIQKLSLQYKTSTEFLSRMGEVAKLSDSSLESVAKAIQFTQKSAAAAYDGTAKYADAYKALHINIQEFIRMTPEEQFLKLTEAFGQVSNASRRTALGMTIMGRSGTEMFRIMDGGTEKIKEVWQESDKMGNTLSTIQANQLAQFSEAIKRLQSDLQGLTIRAVAPASANLQSWADRLGIVRQSLVGLDLDEISGRVEFFTEKFVELDGRIMQLARGPSNDRVRAEMERARDEVQQQLFGLLKRKRELENELLKPNAQARADDGLGESAKAAAQRRKEQIYDMEQWLATYKREIALEKTHAENNELLTGILDKRNEANAEVVRGLQEEKQKLSMTSEELAVYEAVSRLSTDATEEQKVAVGELAREIQAVKDGMEVTAEASKKTYQEMSEFARQAARNMENTFSDLFFNVMQGKFDNLAGDFVSTLERMAADLAASEVLKYLTGDFGNGGQLGGIVGKVVNWGSQFFPHADGGVMTSDGPLALQRYAAGGIASSPQVALFGEGSRPEAYVPLPDGRRIPVAMQSDAGAPITQHFHISAPRGRVEPESLRELSAKVYEASLKAYRRNR